MKMFSSSTNFYYQILINDQNSKPTSTGNWMQLILSLLIIFHLHGWFECKYETVVIGQICHLFVEWWILASIVLSYGLLEANIRS
jgi:hypothetical protein